MTLNEAIILLDNQVNNSKKLSSPRQIGDIFASPTIKSADSFTEHFIKDLGQQMLSILLLDKSPGVYYNFSNEFRGESYILFPFQCFIKAISKINKQSSRARLFHLIQSSGSGKTRLCFEFLKVKGRGLYCVYRQPGSTGYPPTTPWFRTLIQRFIICTSKDESVHVCLQFIELALEHFQAFKVEGTSTVESVVNSFEGRVRTDFTPKFDVGYKTTLENHAVAVEARCKVNLFTIVFDEYHELLITPNDKPDLKSLYQSFIHARS